LLGGSENIAFRGVNADPDLFHLLPSFGLYLITREVVGVGVFCRGQFFQNRIKSSQFNHGITLFAFHARLARAQAPKAAGLVLFIFSCFCRFSCSRPILYSSFPDAGEKESPPEGVSILPES